MVMTDWFLNFFFQSNSAASASKYGSLSVGPSNSSGDSVFCERLLATLLALSSIFRAATEGNEILFREEKGGNGIPPPSPGTLPTVATLLGKNRTDIGPYLEFNTLENNLLKVCQNG